MIVDDFPPVCAQYRVFNGAVGIPNSPPSVSHCESWETGFYVPEHAASAHLVGVFGITEVPFTRNLNASRPDEPAFTPILVRRPEMDDGTLPHACEGEGDE